MKTPKQIFDDGNWLVIDCEANGYLRDATVAHCMAMVDPLGKKLATRDDMHGAVQLLKHKVANEGTILVGHNLIGYDLPLIEKLYGVTFPVEQCVDTLILSKMLPIDMRERDAASYAGARLEPKDWGAHNLRVWGQRLRKPKGDFAGPWDTYSDVMGTYCLQDAEVGAALFEHLATLHAKYGDAIAQAMLLENKVQRICTQMELDGFPFDRDRAIRLYSEIEAERLKMQEELRALFPTRTIVVGQKIAKVNNKKLGRVKGEPYDIIKVDEFNPNSRQQIAARLTEKYGWQPKDYTPKGGVKIDEAVLAGLKYPEAKRLAYAMMLEKRLGQIGSGEQAWILLAKEHADGWRVHGSVNPLGTVTHRATHHSPNISQAPAASPLVPYGIECRSCFTALPGQVLIGTDLSSLELRMLGHYLHRYDGGTYARLLVDGDPHQLLADGLQLPGGRGQAKTLIYAYLYGAGNPKLGEIVQPELPQRRKAGLGKMLRERLVKVINGLEPLQADISKMFRLRGYLIGLDGRPLQVRSDHAALNVLLQSAGAIVSKQWIVNVSQRSGITLHAWVHDELQLSTRPEHAERVMVGVVSDAQRTQEQLNLKVRIDAEAKCGSNWAETH